MGFHAHRVDALFRPLAIGEVVQAFDNALLVEVDGRCAAGLRHREAFRNIVDGNDLLRAEQDRTADGHLSDRSAAPYGHRVRGLDVALHRGLPAGGKDVAQEQHLLIGKTVPGHFDVRLVGVRNPDILRLAAGVAAREMGVSKQARGRVAEHLVGDVFVPVGSLADREVAASALLAFSADDRERNDDALADLQGVLAVGPHLHDFAHELVAHDVAILHAWHVTVIEVQIGAADRATRDFDDGVARVLDPGIRNLVAPNVLCTVPTQGFHCSTPLTR